MTYYSIWWILIFSHISNCLRHMKNRARGLTFYKHHFTCFRKNSQLHICFTRKKFKKTIYPIAQAFPRIKLNSLNLIFSYKEQYLQSQIKLRKNSSHIPCNTLMQVHLTVPNMLAPNASRSWFIFFAFKKQEYLLFLFTWIWSISSYLILIKPVKCPVKISIRDYRRHIESVNDRICITRLYKPYLQFYKYLVFNVVLSDIVLHLYAI